MSRTRASTTSSLIFPKPEETNMRFRSLAADDIFISYTRLDASTYAAGLADELTKKGFSCFIDKLGTDPDKDLPDMLRRKIKSCAMLVVVGTERAATRETIAEEVSEFLATGRRASVVPIDFGGAVYSATWYPLVEGIAPEPEKNPEALDDGEPSPSVLSRIEKQFNYTRRNQRLRRAAIGMAVLLTFLLLAGIGAGVYARQQIVQANNARTEADAAKRDAATERDKALVAKGDAERERTEADKQRKLADEAADAARLAEVRAGEATRREQVARELEAKATANARLQETIGSSRARATAALRFGAAEPDHALTESVEAYRIHPTVEARGSLLASLELYPNLVGVARENPNPIVSLASLRNGAVLVSSDDTGLVLFWDAGRKQVLKRIESPDGRNYGTRVACAAGGSVCAVDYWAKKLTIWEVEARGEGYEVVERASFDSPTPADVPVYVGPVFASPDLLVALVEGIRHKRKQDVALVDFGQNASQPVVKSLFVSPDVGEHDFGTARALAASAATKTIAIGFNRGVALWRIDALDQPGIWVPHAQGWSGNDHITDSLSFSPDGKYLAVSVNGGDVGVWDLSEEEPKLVNNPHPDAGTYVALFNDKLNRREATYLVTAKRTGEITLWDIWNPAIWVRSFKPGISALISVGDTGMVATGSSDGLLASWYMGRESRLRQSLAGVESKRAFAFGRTSGVLYAASHAKREGDSGSRLWREERGHYKELAPDERPPEFPAGEFGLQLLPDVSSEYIALRDVYGSRPEEIRVAIKHTPSAPRAVSLDGRRLAVGNSTRPWNISEVEPTSIVVWDISDRAGPRRLSSLDFDGRPVSFTFGEDGSTLAASYDNGRIVLWDYIKGTKRRQVLVPEAYDSEGGRKHSAGRVALSPDGRLLAAKSNGPVSLWDIETGLLLGRLGPQSYPFRLGEDYQSDSMVFSRDGKALLVSAGYGGGIDLWNLDPEAWAAMASNITGRR
jgi:WD40 repeat protein